MQKFIKPGTKTLFISVRMERDELGEAIETIGGGRPSLAVRHILHAYRDEIIKSAQTIKNAAKAVEKRKLKINVK